MARRGRCRCGFILTFHRTAQGYKMRCPSCGAVVRLRVKGKKRRPPDKTVLRPSTGDLPSPDEIDVELVALPQPAGPAPRRGKRWLIAAGGCVVLLAAAGGLVWWLW